MNHSSQGPDDDTESRTASVSLRNSRSRLQGETRSHSMPSPTSASTVSDSVDMGNAGSVGYSDPFKSAQDHFSLDSPPEGNMASTTGFGNNRLATGFKGPSSLMPQPQPENPNAPSNAPLSPGSSVDDAIEISSDDGESSEGGVIVINIDDTPSTGPKPETRVKGGNDKMLDVKKDTAMSGVKDEDISAPQDTIDQDVEMQLHAENQRYLDASLNGVQGSSPTTVEPVLRLRDLSKTQLALQLKYAFFDTSEEDVDLDLPATCLTCLTPGHTEQACPEHVCTHCSAIGEHPSRFCPKVARCSHCREHGHDAESCTGMKVTTVPCDLCARLYHTESSCPRRFFKSGTIDETKPVALWISCCKCASKMHLVGDCPDARKPDTGRWSLKPFGSVQITNLNLEDRTKQMEHEAMNRGMRPEGLKIRGRAGVHTAGAPDVAQQPDDNDQPFLGPRVKNQPKGEFTFRHPLPSKPQDGHFDRYDPPMASHAQSSRQPNNWYATDSFGQPQTTSPSRPGRRGDDQLRRRSRSPRGYDGQRGDRRRSPPTPRDGPRSIDYQGSHGPSDFHPAGPPINPPRQGISIQLPLRRGSNNDENQPPALKKAPTGTNSNAASNNSAPANSKKKSRKGKANANKRKANVERTYYADLVYRHATTTDQIGKAPMSTCTYPIPDYLILERYLKWISERRDQCGQPPIILEYDRNRKPLFVDTSAPNLIRPTTQRDLESVWLWAADYFMITPIGRDKGYFVVRAIYEEVLKNDIQLSQAIHEIRNSWNAVIDDRIERECPNRVRLVSLRSGRRVPMDL